MTPRQTEALAVVITQGACGLCALGQFEISAPDGWFCSCHVTQTM